MKHAGVPLGEASGAVILLHGRGGSAEDILSLAGEFDVPDVAYLAPQAAGNTWYPNSFLAPLAANEPWRSTALRMVEEVVRTANEAGIATERIVIGGFSQGACLATEFVATHARRYGGLIAFTGGLMGPLGSDVAHEGDLAGTPAFLGSGDPDPHVPWRRVEESAGALRAMGAVVTLRRYAGRGHTVSPEEIGVARGVIFNAALTAPGGRGSDSSVKGSSVVDV